MINPKLAEMIRYAKRQDCAECIELTTNGTLLNPELSEKLTDAGLDILNISVNGLDGAQYEKTCGYRIDYGEFVQNIRYFYEHRKQCKVFIKLGDTGYTQEQKGRFYRIFDGCCDEIFIEGLSSTLWQETNIGENIPKLEQGLYGQELVEKLVCPFLFTTMVVNHEGIAHLCCADWKSEYLLGDLKKEKINEVWNGEKLLRYRCAHLRGEKNKVPLCRSCESLNVTTTDNIDGCRDIILARIENASGI